MSDSPILLWFRNDLRLRDNDALSEAVRTGRPLIPCFIWSPEDEEDWRPGEASNAWLHHSLGCLAESLAERGLRLILRQGPAEAELGRLIAETGATAVFWNRRYEPAIIARDSTIKQSLGESGLEARSWNSSLLIEPTSLLNKSGRPFQVFTPFWKACLKRGFASPTSLPGGTLRGPNTQPASLNLERLELLPSLDWGKTVVSGWKIGETAARNRLRSFARQASRDYQRDRDIPSVDGTSALSPHLHFGEIGPREIAAAIRAAAPDSRGAQVYLSEIGWREFAHSLLFHFPHTTTEPLKADFERFPWEPDETLLRRWQRGETGYPIVDAGMRQLWQTGWMHNRVRMIVASFLVKHLLQPWQRGAEWFWDTLFDADLASNTLGWQWTAGCGADAAPYFRVFNPTTQGEKFDPVGNYVRRWVPELKAMPDKFIHQPWAAPGDLRRASADYPAPLVDHKQARARALLAYDRMRL